MASCFSTGCASGRAGNRSRLRCRFAGELYMSAQSIVRALGGRWHGSYGMAKCVSHDDGLTPALKISDDPRKKDGIDVVCFAGCDWQDVKTELRQQGLLGEFAPEHRSLQGTGAQSRQPAEIEEPEPDSAALAIWQAAIPINGTLAEHYLLTHRSL